MYQRPGNYAMPDKLNFAQFLFFILLLRFKRFGMVTIFEKLTENFLSGSEVSLRAFHSIRRLPVLSSY